MISQGEAPSILFWGMINGRDISNYVQYIYRVFNKFSHTIDIAFVDKWFIWWLSLQNTKFTLISYTHFQKISLRSLIHDLSHSLQSNQRSSSKFAQVLIVVSALLISVLLDEYYENNIFLVKLWLFREIFSFFTSVSCQNLLSHLNEISEAEMQVLSILSFIIPKKCSCANFEFDLWLFWRL